MNFLNDNKKDFFKYEQIAKDLLQNRAVASNEIVFSYMGESMNPFLDNGDLLIVKKVDMSQIRFGDIIVYENDLHYVAHRYLYSRIKLNKGREIIAKADNCSERDKPFLEKCLIGKCVEIRKKGSEHNIVLRKYSCYFLVVSVFSIVETVIFEFICLVRLKLFPHLRIHKNIRIAVSKGIILFKLLFQKLYLFFNDLKSYTIKRGFNVFM